MNVVANMANYLTFNVWAQIYKNIKQLKINKI